MNDSPLDSALDLRFAVAVAAVVALISLAPRPDLQAAADPDRAAQRQAAEAVRDAELAFAARAGVINVRDAFLEFFAPDGIGFQPGPYVAPPDYAAGPPWGVDLQWWPTEVGVSADGKMGYSTGPVERRKDRKDAAPRSFGTYLSIWKLDAQGVWKVAADIGTSPPSAAGQRKDPVIFRLPETATKPAPAGSLLAADRAFAEAAAKDPKAAARAVAASTYRLHLPDQLPRLGAEKALGGWQAGPCRWSPGQEGVAASGDFGFTTGTGAGCYATANTEEFGYLRIWRVDEQGAWRLLVEAVNTAPPKG